VQLRSGMSAAVTQFVPAGEGDTTLKVTPPEGFSVPAEFATLAVAVQRPGLALSDGAMIGQNLQIGGVLTLGQAAPAKGLNATIVSEDPARLLLSTSASSLGSGSITLKIPPGETSGRYYLQALAQSGTVTYKVTAPGYRDRSATIMLAPSGIIIAPMADVSSKEASEGRKAPVSQSKLTAKLSKGGSARLGVWTVQLDPLTHRCTDANIQPLRGGFSVAVQLTNSDPAVGKVASEVTITEASEHSITDFKPLSAGSSEISVITPKAFTSSANSTSMIAEVEK